MATPMAIPTAILTTAREEDFHCHPIRPSSSSIFRNNNSSSIRIFMTVGRRAVIQKSAPNSILMDTMAVVLWRAVIVIRRRRRRNGPMSMPMTTAIILPIPIITITISSSNSHRLIRRTNIHIIGQEGLILPPDRPIIKNKRIQRLRRRTSSIIPCRRRESTPMTAIIIIPIGQEGDRHIRKPWRRTFGPATMSVQIMITTTMLRRRRKPRQMGIRGDPLRRITKKTTCVRRMGRVRRREECIRSCRRMEHPMIRRAMAPPAVSTYMASIHRQEGAMVCAMAFCLLLRTITRVIPITIIIAIAILHSIHSSNIVGISTPKNLAVGKIMIINSNISIPVMAPTEMARIITTTTTCIPLTPIRLIIINISSLIQWRTTIIRHKDNIHRRLLRIHHNSSTLHTRSSHRTPTELLRNIILTNILLLQLEAITNSCRQWIAKSVLCIHIPIIIPTIPILP
mmetsp:Transcript_41198/g.74263  ORF Transcript_41198/g.74263 Transcript_41198/m.74263 type:complete len:455 (+) Transcript_41198:614-1978(+)